MSFNINYILNNEFCKLRNDGVATGSLSISINDINFPSLYWNDFILRVLSMWMESCIELCNGDSVQEFSFMDGSYFFLVRTLPNNRFNIKCYDDYKETEVQVEIERIYFYKEIFKACKQIFSFYKREYPEIKIENEDFFIFKLMKMNNIIKNAKQ